MNDSMYYQNKRKLDNKNEHKKPLDDMRILLIALGVFSGLCMIAYIVVIIFSVKENEANRNDCEAIGGEYQIVDTEKRAMTTIVNGVVVTNYNTVNIYGCVK